MAVLLVRRVKEFGSGVGKQRRPTIGEALTTHRHSMVANSVLEVAADGTKRKQRKQQERGQSAGSLGTSLPTARRATINKSRGANRLEVVASAESKYFDAMEGDVLEEHVLVYEGSGMYAIPLDTTWVDPNPTVPLFEAPPPAYADQGDPDFALDSVDHAFGTTSAAFPFDFAESEQMVSTSFAAMGGATETFEYLDVLGTPPDMNDEYLDVVWKGAGDDNDNEYLEVDGGDDGDDDAGGDDFLSVLSALNAVATSSSDLEDGADADTDEYLEVAGGGGEEEGDEDEEDGTGGISFSKPRPGRLKNIWAPTGAIRAPKMVFRKGSAWNAGTTKVVAVNAFKHGSRKRHGSGESTVDDISDEDPEEPPPLLPRLLPKPARLLAAAGTPSSTVPSPTVFPGMLDGLTMLPVAETNDERMKAGGVASRYQPAGLGVAARYNTTGMVRAPSFVIRRLPRSNAGENDEEL